MLKAPIESEKGLLFDAFREQLDKIIEECGFESVLNASSSRSRTVYIWGEL
jgi:hypothetical protein